MPARSSVTTPPRKFLPLRLVFAAFWLLLLVLLALNGGVLNRARGGMHPFVGVGYWSAHIRSRLLMAGPTAALVLFLSVHFRASVVIFLMTWFSLYTGWGTYFNIGNSPTSYLSRSGVFDWALGRSEANWTYEHRYLREYTGMSLRGLLWTGPAGYALNMMGLGWHYSLAGSWMGFVYYLGGETPSWNTSYANRNLNGQIQWSEFYWGWWIWFTLEMTCLAYLVMAIRKRLQKKTETSNTPLHYTWNLLYEIIMFILNMIFACSTAYYQLVEQKDLKNKGQTFFGLFTGVLFLTFAQAFNWGMWWQKYQFKQKEKTLLQSRNSFSTSSEHLQISEETTPLLPWPQNHPNIGQRLRATNGIINERPTCMFSKQCSKLTQIWQGLEMVIHLDTFVIIRWLLGSLSALHTILVLMMFVICVVCNIDAPRFMKHPYT